MHQAHQLVLFFRGEAGVHHIGEPLGSLSSCFANQGQPFARQRKTDFSPVDGVGFASDQAPVLQSSESLREIGRLQFKLGSDLGWCRQILGPLDRAQDHERGPRLGVGACRSAQTARKRDDVVSQDRDQVQA